MQISATFSDPNSGDQHAASIDWGDATISAGTVVESGGAGTVTGSHAYADGGIYTITITVIDNGLASDTASGTAFIAGVGLHGGVLQHFFAAAAEAMRRILVEQARRKARRKRGADLNRVELDDVEITLAVPGDDIVALDEALTRLAEKHPERAELIKLRYFAGLTVDEAAKALGISPATADRHWTYARAWLLRALSSHRES